MKDLRLSDNILRERRIRGITQEDLANFIGVSKASVSKWETGQSFPDITYLPQLAKFFNTSIDDLMGYEPQLDKITIKKLYQQLANEFTVKPFEDMMRTCNDLIKKYYSCYPFLLQICILYMNHCRLAGTKERQEEIINEAINLCEHIKKNSDDTNLCKDTITVEAACYIFLQMPKEALNLLGPSIHPYAGTDIMIAQSYQMLGDLLMANSNLQISMYQNLVSVIQVGSKYMLNQMNDEEAMLMTASRLQIIIDTYDIDYLHPATSSNFYYSLSIIYATLGKQEEALNYLKRFISTIETIYNTPYLHGDNYFNLVETWLQDFDLGSELTKNKDLLIQDAIEALTNPVFDTMKSTPIFKNLQTKLMQLSQIACPTNPTTNQKGDN